MPILFGCYYEICRYLNIAMDESIIRSQDYFTVLAYIANNPKGEQLVWDFYRYNSLCFILY